MDSDKKMDELRDKELETNLEEVDSVAKNSPQKKKYCHAQRNSDKRELVTIFGTIEFKRIYYKHQKYKAYVYFLDELIRLQKYDRIDISYEKLREKLRPYTFQGKMLRI